MIEGETKLLLYRRVCSIFYIFYLPIIVSSFNCTRCAGKKCINLKRTLRDIRSKFNSFICYIYIVYTYVRIIYTRSTTNYIVVRGSEIYNIIVSQACMRTFIIHFQLNKLRINIILYLLRPLYGSSRFHMLKF